MLAYDLDDKLRMGMANQHRLVQGAIATLANRKFGIEEAPTGIGSFQGGVLVNNRQIAMKRNHVIDDFRKGRDIAPEEQAVVDALGVVAALWRANGENGLSEFTPVKQGDPLRHCLGVTRD